MKRRNLLILLGTASAGGSLLLGSGAYTENEAPRRVSADVVGDGDAYLSLEFTDSVSFDCSADVDVTIRNRTTQALDSLVVDFSTGAGMVDDLSVSTGGTATFDTDENTLTLDSGSVPVGVEVAVTATVAGFTGVDATTLAFGVTAAGDSVSVRTESDREIALDYDCPGSPLSLACPFEDADTGATSAEGESMAVCDNLAFDDGALPDDGSVDVSAPPEAIRERLNAISGIDLGTTEVFGPGLTGVDRMPDDPSALDLDSEALIGETSGDGVAAIPGDVALTDGAAIVGELEVGGTLDLRGSAIAGDVTAAGTDRIVDATVVGSLTDGGGGEELHIGGSSVCGSVDVGGPIERIEGSEIGGRVTAAGDIGSDDDAVRTTVIGGGLSTADGGSVWLEDATVYGDVDADGAIPSLNDTDVGGSVAARRDVGSDGDPVTNAAIDGDLTTTDGDVWVAADTTVQGDVGAGSAIPSLENAEIVGNVRSAGPVGVDGGEAIRDTTVCGSVDAGGRIRRVSNSRVNGSVTAAGDIGGSDGHNAVKNATVGGDLTTTDGGNAWIENSDVGGGVDVAGALPVLENTEVFGPVSAAGDIGTDEDTVKNATIHGPLTAGGDVSVAGATVRGHLEAEGAVRTVGGSTIDGHLEAEGNGDSVIENATINGHVTADGDVSVKGSTVSGDLDATGAVTVEGSTIRGDVDPDGHLMLKNATIEGELSAFETDVTCRGRNAIGGAAETCSTYFSDDEDE